MEVRVLRGGMQTTVQDLGRRGHRAAGVPLSGAMDAFALRVANLLVGNPENAAALEFALIGPELEFAADAMIALGGAEFEGLPSWKPVAVRAGERLKVGACVRGCRGYLAITGGIEVEPVLGSRSTYLRGGFGGFAGRALKEGDGLRIKGGGAALTAGRNAWSIDPRILPAYATGAVRVLRGAHADEFGEELFTSAFKILPESDRMGVRLSGTKLNRTNSEDLLSAAVAPGTVQVPPDGQPLILMADAQTIGGYPQAAHVIAVDLPLVAQSRPGDVLRFIEVSIEEAHGLALVRERAIAMLREGLAEKLGFRSPTAAAEVSPGMATLR